MRRVQNNKEPVPERGPTHAETLRRRIDEIEQELATTIAKLAALPVEPSVLPGLYAVVETVGLRAALRAVAIREIIRMVELAALPAAPAYLLGTFLYRGEPVVVVDLARALGSPHETGLATQLLILTASTPVALAVDSVTSLIENPRLAGTDESPSTLPGGWSKNGLALMSCRAGKELLPLLEVGAVAALAAKETR